MAAGGSFDVMAEKEANMEETKKSRGAWEIHVREVIAGQSAHARHDGCGPIPSGSAAHHNERKIDKKEE